MGFFETAKAEIERINELGLLTFNPNIPVNESQTALAYQILSITKDELDHQSDSVAKHSFIHKKFKTLARFVSPDKHINDGIHDAAQKAYISIDIAQQVLIDQLTQDSFGILNDAVEYFKLVFHVLDEMHSNPNFWNDEKYRLKFEQLDKQRYRIDPKAPSWTDIWDDHQKEEASRREKQKKYNQEREQHEEERRSEKEVEEKKEQELAQKIQSFAPIFEVVRNNFFQFTGSTSQYYYPPKLDLERKLSNFKFINPELTAALTSHLSFFFDTYESTSEDAVKHLAKKGKLQPIEVYKEKASKIANILFEMKLMVGWEAICNIIDNRFFYMTMVKHSNCYSSNKRLQLASTTAQAFTFKEFIDQFTGNDVLLINENTTRLTPQLDSFVVQQKEVINQLILYGKILRFAFYENNQSLSDIQKSLDEIASYFTRLPGSSMIDFIENSSVMSITEFSNHIEQELTSLNDKIFQVTLKHKLPYFSEKLIDSPPITNEALETVVLKAKLETVLEDYNQYSLNHCQFSIFHRHGATGRARATNLVNDLLRLSDAREIRKQLIEYLENKQNGNTHAHSFRTMVLQSFLGTYSNSTFSSQLASLKAKWADSGNSKQLFTPIGK